MAEKLKLGIIGDAGAPTGFATVTHNLVRELTKTGEFEVEIIGINYDGRPNQWSKEFKIWPARLGGDLLGIGLIPEFLQTFKPDVFMMFQDFWNIPTYIAQCPADSKGLVTYYPVDSPNVKGQFVLPMSLVAQVMCYTQFGVNETIRAAKEAWGEVKNHATYNNIDVFDRFGIQISAPMDPFGRTPPLQKQLMISAWQLKQLTLPENYKIIPHGVDLSAFHKLPNKYSARKQLNLPVKGFYIGNVNRNQSRKRQDLSIRAFAKFHAKYPDSKLLLHCVKIDGQGWDLAQLAAYYDVKDSVIFTHDLFSDQMATEEQLNLLYNILDVQINTGGGEGWGLTSFEGAAAGVAQIVPDWSATQEIWKDSGLLLKVASVRHEPAMINTMQAVVDTDHLVDLLSECHDNPALLESVGYKCFEVTQRPEYKWENVAVKFAEVFKNAVGKGPTYSKMAITPKGVQELKLMNQGKRVEAVSVG